MLRTSKSNFLKIVIANIILLSITTISIILILANSAKLVFKIGYFYVYYDIQSEAINASTISSTIQNFGGAGYIIKENNKFYITISCYYAKDDAQAVCDKLKNLNFNCDILSIEVNNFNLPLATKSSTKKLYLSNLNTLNSLSNICYQTANNMDIGEYDQDKVKSTIAEVANCINQLLRTNTNNAFTQNLNFLYTLSTDFDEEVIFSRQVRQLQIALTDCIINTL